MCTGKCSKLIGALLFPTAVLCIIANLFLFFPNFDTKYIQDPAKITPEVLYMGGILGSGALVLISASHIYATGSSGCCNNRCGMFLSVLLSGLGVVGSGYCFAVSVVGLVKGPTCVYNGQWIRPFNVSLAEFSGRSYLFQPELWGRCVEPRDVVLFNTTLFLTLSCLSSLQFLLCLIQMVNGLCGCVCGTCRQSRNVIVA
ncbi:transmembrane 4 L6 family member 5 [Callorhinchus milii]|uniref:Transmembrane 4 L6 family member 5-like n=1 Tax=Callorhinchus milii TaxID=7868 RepID=V9KTL6_CALMI|nr:transmembrane 4 L6 family member 5 [Callorhinchus milii]|eukprot:gi/632986605/ref/XP_007910332.1/ PREDICTED: transmembrane 4 L6 family member 5-like [Callorhinchus milii]